MTEIQARRLASVRAKLEAANCDVFLVTSLPNIRYLTGFTGSAALFVLFPQRAALITDFRYQEQVIHECSPELEVVIAKRSVWERLSQLLSELAWRSLGIESEALQVRDWKRLEERYSDRVKALTGIVESIRVVKDRAEVAAIRKAAELAVESLESVLTGVKPGLTEQQVAAALEYQLRERGSEWHPFPTIVAAGPRSALPHARSTSRPIGRGELLLIDFGFQYQGYCADLTRCFVIGGPPDGRQQEIYQVVLEAQRTAIRYVRPGMSGREADLTARKVITSAGFGDYFGHGLGHGLGLEVHEDPRLSATAETRLAAGAVVTIEPGVYLPGWGGVRLEDDVVLTQGVPELLSEGCPDTIRIVD